MATGEAHPGRSVAGEGHHRGPRAALRRCPGAQSHQQRAAWPSGGAGTGRHAATSGERKRLRERDEGKVGAEATEAASAGGSAAVGETSESEREEEETRYFEKLHEGEAEAGYIFSPFLVTGN